MKEWLDEKFPPDVTQAEKSELLDIWLKNRNKLQGNLAADEMMKRLWTDRKMEEST